MLRDIRDMISLQRKDWVLGYLLILGGWVLGFAIMLIICRFDQGEEIFPMGGLICSMLFTVYWAACMLLYLPFWFSMAVSMGRTRKRFFVSYFAAEFTEAFLGLTLMLLLTGTEEWVYRMRYPDRISVTSLASYGLKYGVFAAAVLLSLCGVCAAMIMKWGKRVFAVLWLLWMFLCMGVPQILSASKEAPESIFGRAGKGLIFLAQSLRPSQWAGVAMAVTVAAIAGSYLILRRQRVDL